MALRISSSRSMRQTLLLPLGLLALCVLPLLGCGEDGGECDRCEVDADCKMGLVCVNFRDDEGNLVGTRCGSGTGATQCRVR